MKPMCARKAGSPDPRRDKAVDNGGLRYGAMESALRPPLPTATPRPSQAEPLIILRRPEPRPLDQSGQAKHHPIDPRKQTPGGRHQIGIPAGFKSVCGCRNRRPTPACGLSCKASIRRRWRLRFGCMRLHGGSASSGGLVAIAVDGKTLRGSFDAFSDRKAAQCCGIAAGRSDRARPCDGRREEQRDPGRAELIEALGMEGCLFTLDAEHCQGNL